MLNNQYLILTGLILSVIRIYLQVIKFDFSTLPLTAKLPKEQQMNVHQMGFYLSLGYFILFAPQFI